MLAVRLHGRGDLRVDTITPPSDPRAHQVLIKPRSCGICGTDLHELVSGPIIVREEPHPLTGARIPQILGHEFAGDVISIGELVTSVKPGDRVAVMPLISCGRCSSCSSGRPHLCQVMACTGLTDTWGGMAEAALVNDHQVHVLPPALSYDEGALIEPAAVAWRAIERARRHEGESALITGGGPIGALVAVVGAAVGLGKVFVSEPNAMRRAHLEEAGIADLILDPTTVDVTAEILGHTSGAGVDVAFECAGQPSSLETCVAAVRRGGTVVQVALFTRPATVDPYLWCFKDLRIEAIWGYMTDVWPPLIAMAAEERLRLGRIVTSRVPLSQATEGFNRLLGTDSSDVKVIVDCG